MNGQQVRLDALVQAVAQVAEVPPEPEHDGDYWRGALKVIAERSSRIDAELVATEQQAADLRRHQRLTERARRDAVVASRSKLPRSEVARLLGIKPGTLAKLLASELRRRGMGAR